MLQFAVSIAVVLGAVSVAGAAELPARKAGLWDLKMSFEGRPTGRDMQQCIDAATDQMMQSPGGVALNCSKREVQTLGNTITMDSVCTVNGHDSASHAVITGSFDSAYTMVNTTHSDRAGSPAPGASSLGTPGQTTITMDAKWLGACKPDQKPGDMIMPGGRKINVLEMRRMGAPPSPAPPR